MERSTGEVTSFDYDYRNRLTAATEYSSANAVQHAFTATFDVFDRRIGFTADGVQTWTVYDGKNAWADFNSTGAVAARYLAGDRSDELYARWHPTDGIGWYLQDRMFSVRDIINATGAVVNHVEYDAFGAVSSETGTGGDRFKYTGREYDSSTELYHYRARAFDPVVGRFLQQDPLGQTAGDTNLYRYVFNTPTLYRDPSGMTAMVGYALQVGKITMSVIGNTDFKICVSEESTRLVYTASLDIGGWSAEASAGVLIAPYGIPVPRMGQMSLCVESSAQLWVTAFANGVFGVTAMAIDLMNTMASKQGTTWAEIAYAEPDQDFDGASPLNMFKLRVSTQCGTKKLQRMGEGRGPEWLELKVNTSNSDEGGANAGEGEERTTNRCRGMRRQARLKKVALKKGNQKPRYENPGHHDEKNKPVKFQYNQNKDPLPKDAHSVYESSIQYGNKRYGRSTTGEYYQYNHSASTNPKSKFDCKEGAYHFAGRTGKEHRGFPIPKAVSDYFGG